MASKYYDPQKAHEYYEKHKKLKGRRSTKSFTDSQKAMYSYVKNDLKQKEKAEKSEASESTKLKKSTITERAKAERKAFTEACKAKVAELREKLKGMSKDQKIIMKQKINAQISAIKEQFANAKADVTAKAKDDRASESANLKSTKEKISENYDKKLDQAYSSIKSNKKVSK